MGVMDIWPLAIEIYLETDWASGGVTMASMAWTTGLLGMSKNGNSIERTHEE
jgi:hypothetical protein